MRTNGAYILARYSTDRQNPDSIEVQVERCRAWCDAQGVPVLDVFADEAVSGMKDDRPQYHRMMRQLAAGGANTVVIYDQSRMFRKMTAWFTFRDEIESMGVRVVSVTQPAIGGDLRDPTNFLTEGSMALFNQIWALQTRQKVTEKMKYMARNGQHTGGKPALGYAVEDGHLVICEEEAAIVREIFGRYAAGESGLQIIASLNAAGRRTKNGRPFGANSLHDLLRNEKYIGTMVYGRSARRADGTRNNHAKMDDAIRIEDAVPAIVPRDTWERVQIRMDANKKSPGRPASAREYPLKGKVFCGKCKSAMVVSRSYGKYYYYHCNLKKRTGECDNAPIRVEELEQLVADAVRQLLGTPGNLEALMEILREQRANLQSGAAEKLSALVARRADISRQLDSAVEAVLGGLNSPTLTRRVQELETEKSRIEHEMNQLHSSVNGASVTGRDLAALIPAALADDGAIFSLVARVEVYPDRITVWTLLDTDPDGDIDYDGDGLLINLGDAPPAPIIVISPWLIMFSVRRD